MLVRYGMCIELVAFFAASGVPASILNFYGDFQYLRPPPRIFCTITAEHAQKKIPPTGGIQHPKNQSICSAYFTFTSISFGFASSAFGSVSVRMPSLY